MMRAERRAFMSSCHVVNLTVEIEPLHGVRTQEIHRKKERSTAPYRSFQRNVVNSAFNAPRFYEISLKDCPNCRSLIKYDMFSLLTQLDEYDNACPEKN